MGTIFSFSLIIVINELHCIAFPDLAEADDVDLNNYIAAKVMLPKDGHTFA